MRVVLLPVLKNIVRRLVMECAASKGRQEDPAVRTSQKSMEEILRIVREEEGVWFHGVDWAESWRSDDAVKRRKRVQRAREDALLNRRREDDSARGSGSSSTKSASDSSSNATSPVLSAMTLQTTPSPPPPPLSDEGVGVEKKEDYLRPMTIPVSPVLNPPPLLRPISYVPVTTANPPQSLEAFKAVSFYFYIFLSFFLIIHKGFLFGLERSLHSIVSLQMQDLRMSSSIGQCPGSWEYQRLSYRCSISASRRAKDACGCGSCATPSWGSRRPIGDYP